MRTISVLMLIFVLSGCGDYPKVKSRVYYNTCSGMYKVETRLKSKIWDDARVVGEYCSEAGIDSLIKRQEDYLLNYDQNVKHMRNIAKSYNKKKK